MINMQPWKEYSSTFCSLVRQDMFLFSRNIHNVLIDRFIFVTAQITIANWILPYFGLTANFGPFMIGSLIATSCLFEITPFIAHFISDLSGDRKINYEMILPIPTWLVFIKIMVSFALRALVIGTAVIPVAKILLREQFVLSSVSWPSLVLMLIMTSILTAAFGLLVTSFTRGMHVLSSIWARCIFPLWIFGGFQFSWAALNNALPWLSYVSLFNPIFYTTEGFRAAILPEGNFIAVKICVPVLICFSLVCAVVAIMRFKRRLDFV